MSDITKVIIAFAALIVIGASIIGYGLWRKARTRGDQETVLRQARTICDTAVASFVQMDAEAREKLLERADRLKRQIGGFEGLETGEAEALTTWTQEFRGVHSRFLLQERKLRGVLAALKFTPPVEAKEQLSSQEVQTLRKAIASGNEIVGQPMPLLGGGSLTMQAAFPTQTRDITRRVGEVEAEIDNRERAYTTFVTGHSASLASAKQSAMSSDEVKRKVDELRKWLAWVPKCPEKLEKLNQMKAGWDALAASGQEVQAVGKRLRSAYSALSMSSPGTAQTAAIAQGKIVLGEAKRLNAPSLQSDIIRLEIILAKLDPNNQQTRQRETLVAKIITDKTKLSSATSSFEKMRLEGNIRSGVSALKLVDLTYGRFFETVLASRTTPAADPDAAARKSIIKDLGRLKTTSSYRKVTLINEIQSNILKLQSSDPELAGIFSEVLAQRRSLSSSSSGFSPPSPPRRPTSSSRTALKVSLLSLARANGTLKDASRQYFLYTSTTGRSSTYARKLRDAVTAMDLELQTHSRRISAVMSP
jgi:hypothetical protein